MIINKIDFNEKVNEVFTELTKNVPLQYKSKMTIGNIVVMNTEHFNWLQKRIWKILLGIIIEDVEEN